MKVKVVKDAHVLVPNKEHKNFTRSTKVIPAGTILEGEAKIVKGLKRGQAFPYRLFYTNKNEIIYVKNISPMNTTEVKLGVDGAPKASPTKIDFPNTSNLGIKPIGCTLVGAGLGYAFANYKKVEGKKKLFYTIGGGVVGFIIGKYWQSHNAVKIMPAKGKI